VCNLTPVFFDILYNLTHFPGPLVHRIRTGSDILYNPTHFPGPLVCQIRTGSTVYITLPKLHVF
jgi:hypothetical protein